MFSSSAMRVNRKVFFIVASRVPPISVGRIRMYNATCTFSRLPTSHHKSMHCAKCTRVREYGKYFFHERFSNSEECTAQIRVRSYNGYNTARHTKTLPCIYVHDSIVIIAD